MNEAPDHDWITMETIRDPINPWAVLGFGWCLVMATLALAVLLR